MNSSSNRPKVFVMMPFDSEFDEVYKLFITGALNEAGYDVFRADDLRSQRSILQDIISSIVSCDLIVADLTGANPNVFYELGLAHGLKKPVILLTQDLSDIPFDLKPYRVLRYDTHFARVRKARDELIGLAKGALQGTVPFGSPVTDFEGSKVGMPIKVPQAIEVKEPNTEVVEEALDERGFLDHVVDSEEGFNNLTKIIKDIGSATETIGAETQEVTRQIQAAIAKPSSGAASYVRKLARGLAGKFSKYAQIFTEANDKYYTVARNTDNSLEFIVSYQEPTTESGREELRKYLDTLTEVEGSATQGREAFAQLAETIENQPKMEKHLDRARSLCCIELGRFVDNIERTIASIRRAREIGLRKLQDPNINKDKKRSNVG